MISDNLARAFANAARALSTGLLDTGLTGNGIRKLDFKGPDGVIYTALEQNPNKISTPAKLAQQGHKIVQIRNDNEGILMGNFDVSENRFNSYDSTLQPVDIGDIEARLGEAALTSNEGIHVAATSTTRPEPARPVSMDSINELLSRKAS